MSVDVNKVEEGKLILYKEYGDAQSVFPIKELQYMECICC